MVLFKSALLRVEVEVILAESVEDLPDQVAVSREVIAFCFSLFASHVNCYIIYVDGNAPAINEVSEYGVHHGLEGGQGVHQTKEHDCGFE